MTKTEFKPCYMTVLRILRKNYITIKYKTNKKRKHDGHYDTPTEVGIKWQIDVKYVPRECKVSGLEDKFYQYTILDECSRKRSLYFTKERSMYETVKAIEKAIKMFGFKPLILQNDNGFEFSDKAQKKELNHKISYLEKH